jgi:hypothetical protein
LPFLLDIAVAWRQEQGQWPEYHLRWLHRERAVAGAGAFTALLHDHVPEELLGELNTAIDASEDPPEGDSLAGGLVRA